VGQALLLLLVLLLSEGGLVSEQGVSSAAATTAAAGGAVEQIGGRQALQRGTGGVGSQGGAGICGQAAAATRPNHSTSCLATVTVSCCCLPDVSPCMQSQRLVEVGRV
jgi:hypothetical protein